MFFSPWLRFRRLRPPPAPAQPRGRRRTRLHVELLEDRCLLASGMAATLVADIVPGPAGSGLGNLTNVQGTLYFNAWDPATSTQGLWKSDGTASGTVQVKPGIAGTGFTPIGGGTILFVHPTTPSSFESELWKTDGTPQGTVRVKQVTVGGH